MRKHPVLACLLNLILVGTGYMYVGQIGKGVLILLLGLVFGIVGLGILIIPLSIWAMYDVYRIARMMNRSWKKTMQRATSG